MKFHTSKVGNVAGPGKKALSILYNKTTVDEDSFRDAKHLAAKWARED